MFIRFHDWFDPHEMSASTPMTRTVAVRLA